MRVMDHGVAHREMLVDDPCTTAWLSRHGPHSDNASEDFIARMAAVPRRCCNQYLCVDVGHTHKVGINGASQRFSEYVTLRGLDILALHTAVLRLRSRMG